MSSVRILNNLKSYYLPLQFYFVQAMVISSRVCLLVFCVFPSITFRSIEDTTRSACSFVRYCENVGLSLTLPRCLCRPKYFSKGSCCILSLNTDFTYGIVKMYFIMSMKELAIKKNNSIMHIAL